jgi:hypothetical protein
MEITVWPILLGHINLFGRKYVQVVVIFIDTLCASGRPCHHLLAKYFYLEAIQTSVVNFFVVESAIVNSIHPMPSLQVILTGFPATCRSVKMMDEQKYCDQFCVQADDKWSRDLSRRD